MIQYKHCQVTDASLNVHVCFEKKRNKTDGEDKLGTYVSSERMNIKPDWIGLSVMREHVPFSHRTISDLAKLVWCFLSILK